MATHDAAVDLTSAHWAPGDRDRYLAEQRTIRTTAGAASGDNGAVTVAYSAYAARAGLEALKQGGGAVDAALTTALAQVALKAGAPISYFGMMSLVYYEAATGRVHTMNAEWNTVADETDPRSIPGEISLGPGVGPLGTEPSGRTALVGGFMKGVEAAHTRFGTLPFTTLFQPAIELADDGVSVTSDLAWCYRLRRDDLARLPETRGTLLKSDGSGYVEGETLRQPRLAETLRRIAEEGADYMYGGPWGEKLIRAVRAEGGKMTLQDLLDYEVTWADALTAEIGGGYAVSTAPWPNAGGVALIEAQNLARVAGLPTREHWTRSSQSLRVALHVSQLVQLSYLPSETLEALFPGIDFSPEARVTLKHAEELWSRIEAGAPFPSWKPTAPKHSDDVVAVDADGNIAAITHTINSALWGKTAINVDGVSIGDPASYQQELIARTGPGRRLPAPTETGVLFKGDDPVLGFASMGAGLHHRTLQALLNYTAFGMTVEEAVNEADFYAPQVDTSTGQATVIVPTGRFDPDVLDGIGIDWREVEGEDARLGGEGLWVAVERDPATGRLSAASHNRNNSGAVAY